MHNVLFCGFGKLGQKCIEKLIQSGYTIDYILTHKELEAESVDTFADKHGIFYSYKDSRKNLKEIVDIINEIKPKYLISVNYRYIIPKSIYQLTDCAMNIHGSLLPKYRGRTPHVWSIINGEIESGITSHIMEETVDTGAIIEQKNIKIEQDDTGYSLLKKYEALYPIILIDSLNHIEKEKGLIRQNNNEASYYGKRTPDMGYIDFYKNSIDIINFIRAQAEPYPGAYYYLVDGRKIIINKIVVDKSLELISSIGIIKKIKNKFYVRCKDNNLELINYRIIN